MKKLDKNIVAALILGVSLIICTCIYAFSTRYEITSHLKHPIRIDKWAGVGVFLPINPK